MGAVGCPTELTDPTSDLGHPLKKFNPCKTSVKRNVVDVPSSLLLLAITSSKVGITNSAFSAAFRPLWMWDESIPPSLDCLLYTSVLYISSSIC